ncbi:MAG: DNA mismatch repair endonuclease MutL [Proteobacteria bacterium]|nr:DNA mismatch repair endonuclease MutL [Pseudomonadota bacterium]
MGLIQVLDDALINKIAAGEVVERPASVVKELVENSLDAGATRITVELLDGGKKRILVSDNGSGMDQEDAILSLKRHATSKIRIDEDLFNLNTMGFRGEALASIASVSKFTLMTCKISGDAKAVAEASGSTSGVRIYTEGGAPLEVQPWQSSGGTTLVIEDLFFNVPVRAKFLKSGATEYGYVLELMQSLALAWPKIDFTFVHNGKEIMRAPEASNPSSTVSKDHVWTEAQIRERFLQIFKQEQNTTMMFTSAESQYASMTCLISAPGVEKSTSRDIYIFVNGRLVKDRSLRYAILRGYHSHLLRGKFPIALISLVMDPSLVDVNVHPSKTEVRFQFPSELQGMVAMAIRDAIRKGEWASPTLQGANTYQEHTRGTSDIEHNDDLDLNSKGPSRAAHSGSDVFQRSAAESMPRNFSGTNLSRVMRSPALLQDRATVAQNLFRGSSFETSTSAENGLFEVKDGSDSNHNSNVSFHSAVQKGSLNDESIPWQELSYLGSIDDCYLLFSHGERRNGSRLLAVDQHAFHERILYEKLCNNASLLSQCQTMLVPEVIELEPHQMERLQAGMKILEGHGFKMKMISPTILEVWGIPAILSRAEPESLVRAMIEDGRFLSATENETAVLAHDLMSTMACHAAVRAGESLGENELRALIREASTVDFFHNCPHGRRVFKWWSSDQIGRWFDR